MSADNTNRLSSNKPRLFTPTVIRHVREGASGDSFFEKSDSSEYVDTALGSSGTFKYNQPGTGLKSTQQLNVNWADFSNHTFFNSAQVKTNVAFNKIVNEFPFDGTKGEAEVFLDKLTGFEKWLFDQMPKNKGFMSFSGSQPDAINDIGTGISVKDIAGAAYPTLSKKTDAQAIIDPTNKSLSIEMWVYIPQQTNSTYRQEYIVSKLTSSVGSNDGFVVYNDYDSNTDDSITNISFNVSSGSTHTSTGFNIPVNTWSHICFIWNRNPGIQNVFGYLNGMLASSGSMPTEFGDLGTVGSDLYIGSGSHIGLNNNKLYTPSCTFSGSLDELRIWHNVRTIDQIQESMRKPVYANDYLKLYYKFNEPSGSNSAIVLDHSNNSVHGKLNTRALQQGIRDMSSASFAGESPMIYEKLVNCPVLFPAHPDNVELRTNLLLSASLFDSQNPSIITNLVPKHFLLEGQAQDGLQTEEGDITNQSSDETEPGGDKLGGTQVLLSLLYTWAKFFDEMKLYIQAFSSLDKIDYNNFDTIPDEFLNMMANQEGIDLPPLFIGTSINQYIEGENLTNHISTSDKTLQYIQNQIWRRILINLPDVVKSKGTIHSIKSFIRATGIDPDNIFRIREYGGPVKSSLSFARESKTDFSTMLDFVSGGKISSPDLFATRTEPGYPWYGNGVKPLTSGSFTFEGIYKFNKNDISFPQSLVRFESEGLSSPIIGKLVTNLVITSESNGCTITLHGRPNVEFPPSLQKDYFSLPISGVNLFDGHQWYISFGKVRADDPNIVGSGPVNISSSYFLRVAKQMNGEIVESYTTSSWYKSNDFNIFEEPNTNSVKFLIGSASISTIPSASFLDDDRLPDVVRTTNYNGKVSQIRFWSKYLTDQEWKEHVRNFKSVGVQDPKTNWNFTNTPSGSWERLRIDASTDQVDYVSDNSGGIILTDFTQNGFHLTGSDFASDSEVILSERFEYSFISPKIDEGISDNKVRVRSFQDATKLDAAPWAQIAPVHDTDHSLSPKDSAKLSIDFSIVDALDQDIMTIFSSLDEMNNYIGNPELMFAENYKDLEILREMYFNKLQDKINLKGFFEFYKWFDTNIGIFISQLVPRKTKFLGTNFVIESHFLERNKVQYRFEDHWLGDDIRSGLKPPILLQLIIGSINRY